MDARRYGRNILGALAALTVLVAAPRAATVTNPFLWADIPDLSMVRVGSTYYMSFTTMHMAPGVPIMKSTDLVNWKTVGYCYSTLTNTDAMNLANGQSAYGKGSWASSIRYKNGTFYVLVPSYTTGKTHLYSTADVEKGPWKEVLLPFYHDPSLLLDDDGRNYVAYGSGDIKLVELTADLGGVKAGGVNTTIVANASAVAGSSTIVKSEGTHLEKINGWYYLFNIVWPNGSGRTETVYRSKSLTGTWEGKVVLNSSGVAQGSVIQAPDGGWWGYLFQDNGSVGRSPWIMPVTWANDWPVFNGGKAPTSLEMPVGSSEGKGHVTSDDFGSTSLKLEWQWNHNPDPKNWSLSARPGYYRITTGRVDASIRQARNSLTQRSFGPKCSGRIALDASGLKDGDVAGLAAFQDSLGFVGVKNTGGSLAIVKYKGTAQETSVPLDQKRVYLRIDMDFTNRTDKATFFYSLDSANWKPIGNTLQMSYTLGMFMGYRFALFAYSTKTAGGTADFDWFQIGASVGQTLNLYPSIPVSVGDGGAARGRLLSWRAEGGLALRYALERPGTVSFDLVDLRGRSVASLPARAAEAGDGFATLGTAGLPAGRYVLVGRIDGASWGSWPVSIDR